MSVSLMFIKSRYPIKKKNAISAIFFSVLILLSIYLWKKYLYEDISKEMMILIVYSFSVVYYFFKYHIQKNKLYFVEYISEQSKKHLDTVRKCLYISVFFIFLLFVLRIFRFRIDENTFLNLSLLIFIMLIGYMLMNYQCVVGFTNVGYFSGESELKYDEIDKLEEIDQSNSNEGKIISIKIILKNGKLYHDKIMLGEYIYLKNKIYG